VTSSIKYTLSTDTKLQWTGACCCKGNHAANVDLDVAVIER